MTPSTPRASARRALLLLVVVSGALLALVIFQRDRALKQVYEEAQQRAVLYTGTVLRSSLTPRDVQAPLLDDASGRLLGDLQAYVFTDPAVARVRLWSQDGTLLFSTDHGDATGGRSEDPAIFTAADGVGGSRLAEEGLSSTLDPTPRATPLFQTFVPLSVRGSGSVMGAAEVEQFEGVLQERADDPWSIAQTGATAATGLLALMALVAVVWGMRRPAAGSARGPADEPARRGRRSTGLGGEEDALRERLAQATGRARAAESAAQTFATRLQEVTRRLESVEQRSADDRVDELKEALRRSEAERSLLRAGRPETVQEAELRQMRSELREAKSRAKAAEVLVAGGGDLSALQEQLSAAARDVDVAVGRAKVAEERADQAEERARSAGDMATAAEHRIDLLETKLQEVAAAGVVPEGAVSDDARRLVAEATMRAEESARRATEAEARATAAEAQVAAVEAPSAELLETLEGRLIAAEERALDAESRLRAVEEKETDEGSRFRQRLGLTAARKLAARPAALAETDAEPELDLGSAIARGLRAPLTRASGLALTLQGAVESSESKSLLRQLSSSLRRLDQMASDLHEVDRIADGSLRLNRRRTDLAALAARTVDETDRLEDRLVRVDADTVHANVDPARARQIVEGMLDAARERTRSGAAIVVRLRETDAGAWISVEDDNPTPAALGPEIRLAARLAELHGTAITAEGSSFRVVFPGGDRPSI